MKVNKLFNKTLIIEFMFVDEDNWFYLDSGKAKTQINKPIELHYDGLEYFLVQEGVKYSTTNKNLLNWFNWNWRKSAVILREK